MTTTTVFNINSVNQDSTLFLSEIRGLSIQRFDKPKYPQLAKLLDTGIGLFWVPEEVSMQIDAVRFRTLDKADKHVVLSNIKRQVLLDSIMGRSPNMMFAPVCSDPILEALIEWWSVQEMIHSKAYTHIIRNAFPDPESVLNSVMDIENIVKCSETITSIYDNCIAYGNKFYAGECTRLEAVEAIYLAIQAANALESIRFPVSFACSFIYAELGKLPGLGTEIGFINRDESFHVAITNTLLKILPEDDPDFKVVMSDPAVIEKVRALWRESLLEENEWIDYLFSEGDILGLTKTTLRKYLSYVATSRLESLNIGTIEDIIGEHPDLQSTKQNPINLINNWINNKANQPAPQETELNNYERNIIDMNVDLSEILIECGYENNNV